MHETYCLQWCMERAQPAADWVGEGGLQQQRETPAGPKRLAWARSWEECQQLLLQLPAQLPDELLG